MRSRMLLAATTSLLVLAVALFAVACGGGSTTTTSAGGGAVTTTEGVTTTAGGATTTAGSSATSAAGGGNQVSLKNFAFDPASITVKAGDSVTWTNNDSTTHTVTGDNGEFNSGDLAPGATFSFTFKTAGTVNYHCSIHPTMKGTVVVQ